ncbi:MAG: exopolysaccharide biosynthesis polyprenyl glycosylphosphotransferase [Patescibacteria group bacterium]
MTISGKKETTALFLGDVVLLYFSLWLALTLREWGIPSGSSWELHFWPFTIIITVWILVFFISGLYEKHTLILKSRLPSTVFNAQVANSFIAVLFFYFIPYFGIAPKTNLFIYLVISSGFILIWRIYGDRFLHPLVKQKGIIVGSGEEMKELLEEVNNNPKYGLQFISSVDLNRIAGMDFQGEILSRVYSEEVQIIAIDLKNEKVEPILPHLYNLIFSRVKFIDMYKIYEDIFDRIPLSLVRYNWFLENISTESRTAYDFIKRIIDIVLSFVVGAVSLIFYPFVFLAIKIEDGGSLFVSQDRVGKDGHIIKIYKFRSMQKNEMDPTKKSDNQITKVGHFLRKMSIDEFPQFWSVLKGDQALIGPRPELPTAVKQYESEIPYYGIRHLIKPGLSGWAQLYGEQAHHGTDVSKTKNKLSYDLYYIKNRSFMLDLKIILKTIKVLLFRNGA